MLNTDHTEPFTFKHHRAPGRKLLARYSGQHREVRTKTTSPPQGLKARRECRRLHRRRKVRTRSREAGALPFKFHEGGLARVATRLAVQGASRRVVSTKPVLRGARGLQDLPSLAPPTFHRDRLGRGAALTACSPRALESGSRELFWLLVDPARARPRPSCDSARGRGRTDHYLYA